MIELQKPGWAGWPGKAQESRLYWQDTWPCAHVAWHHCSDGESGCVSIHFLPLTSAALCGLKLVWHDGGSLWGFRHQRPVLWPRMWYTFSKHGGTFYFMTLLVKQGTFSNGDGLKACGLRGARLNSMDCCFWLNWRFWLKMIIQFIFLTWVSLNTSGVLILHLRSLK